MVQRMIYNFPKSCECCILVPWLVTVSIVATKMNGAEKEKGKINQQVNSVKDQAVHKQLLNAIRTQRNWIVHNIS